MARLGGLGKGLGALIPPDLQGDDGNGDDAPRLIDVPIDSIQPNPHQPRVHFDEEMLADLAASIREIGVLQPVLAKELGNGRYQLVAGERRWRAARRAGLATIPAIVRATDDLSSIEQALVENLHRQDLTALEEAAAFQQLIEDFQLTHEQLSQRIGKSRSAITNTLRLLTLPPQIQHLLADGRLSAGHARALLGSPDRAFQEHLARRATTEGWSVRAVEEAIRDRQTGQAIKSDDQGTGTGADGAGLTPATRLRAPGLLELEHLLAEYLGTRVSVTMGAKRGRVAIDFADLEDLERIYRRMVEGSTESS